MATLMDLGLFSVFGSIFTFILVWIIVYALLEHTKAFGADKKGINGLIAISVAVLVLASKYALQFVNFVVPWFLILAVVIFLIIFVFKVFGIGDGAIAAAGGKATFWVLSLAIIILLFGFGSIFGQATLDKGDGTNESSISNGDTSIQTGDGTTDTGSFSKNLYNTIFHPKVLGLILMLLIGVIALIFLTGGG